MIHVVPSPRFAGVERHVGLLAKTQAQQGLDVHVVGGRAPDMPDLLSCVPFHDADAPPAAMRAVRRLLRPGSGCVLHGHMTAGVLACGLVRRRRPRDLVIATRHLTTARGRTWWKQALIRPVLPRIDRQIAVSQYVVEQTNDPATVVLPGVPVAPDRRPPHSQVLQLVQRLEPEKDTDVAVEAFRRSGLPDRGWTLRVAGEGTLAAQLRQCAAGLPVEWQGHRHDVPALMASADVLLAPCGREALGLSVLEAMAAGLPVLAAGAGGHLETVGSVDPGLVFTPGDPEALASRLRSLLGSDLAAVGHRLQAVQRQKFTLERQARETLAVYEAGL